jgi:hypothetical protein
MATLRKEIPVAAGATPVWDALRDFGQVHTKVAPGFLTGLKMDNGDRIVTFFNGLVARERLVTLDDAACRLVYAVVEGRASHYNAAVQVFPDGDGSRVVWTIDFLPDELAPAIDGMMDAAAMVMRKTLAEARPTAWRDASLILLSPLGERLGEGVAHNLRDPLT